MIVGLLWLLGCQLAGTAIVELTGIPLPGSVVGMLLLFVALVLRRRDGEDDPVIQVGDYFLSHLQLFFIPAGVGVIAYVAVIRDAAVPIVVALLGSWLLGLATVGWVLTLFLRRVPSVVGTDGAPGEEIE
ncbi:CidA/LrgA family protein [Nocardioides sp. NPDC057772]|uniref:CidA/LrgA family protein n=1 Tax=Nocardioides sp. NPDC057772 TaxID=3346245 RepID=UPI00366FDA5E